MLDALDGMFAFVLYDRARHRLFGARDPLGIKPLHYHHAGGRLAFASEIKTLLALPGFPREIDGQSLYHYLSLRYVPGPGSIFKDVARVPAGHLFRYDLTRQALSVERYWRPRFASGATAGGEDDRERVRAGLKDAVQRWMLSDVPVGCSLSGGLDSSAIVGLLAEAGHSRLKTYSLGFRGEGEEDWSELGLAREVARRWGTDHHELVLTADELLDELVPMVWALDEPYGGGLPSWYVFRMMSRDVKVGLTGTGGDELFGGYGKWRAYERGQAGYRRTWREWWAGERPRSYAHPAESYFLYLDDAEKRGSVLAGEMNGVRDTAAWVRERMEAAEAPAARDAFTAVDLEAQLPEEFLLMTDRFSMAHSLEARVPFLDRPFVEAMLAIPSARRTRPDDLKGLLREAVADLLPAGLLRAPKRGFVLPDALWLRGTLRPLVMRLLGPERLRRQGLFRPDVYARFVAPHLEGRENRAGQVWTLLLFQLWHALFIEARATERPSLSWRDLAAS
jgi:asparagine synthase (glutamine-hydrolysing)